MSTLAPARTLPALLPISVQPMLAETGAGPLDSPDYAYEVKWDGMRVLVGLDGDRISLLTRNRIEALPRFPELRQVREAVRPSQALLDGEIVRLSGGRADFGALQRRIQTSRPNEIDRLARDEPAALILFDYLREGDEWLANLPWETRRERLEAAVRSGPDVQISPAWSDGQALWRSVCAMGFEGVMAKRRSGRYYPGKRNAAWLKIKACRTADVVVGGWTEGTGHRSTTLGALVLGCYHNGKLVPVGQVGTGFNDRDLLAAAEDLRSLAQRECPFEPMPDTSSAARWVRPERVCEVRFLEWSRDGRLRFPVFLRWRPDKGASQCDLPGEHPARGSG